MNIPLWMLGMGDQQGRGEEEKQQMKRGAGLSAITCAGVTRAGLSREIPPLHSKAGGEGAQRLIRAHQ